MGSFSEASGFGFGFGLAAGTDGPQNGDNAMGAFRANFAVRGKKPFMRWRGSFPMVCGKVVSHGSNSSTSLHTT